MRPLSISLLPPTLLALCLALPVFSSKPAPAAPTTPFDAFQAVAAHAQKQPEPPVCCLKPLPSLDHTEEEVLLSFEEWKAKQLSAVQQEQAAARNSSPGLVNNSGSNPAADMPLEANASAAAGVEGGATAAGTGVALEQPAAPPANAPYFRIPLTDRFNYASTDCSARVHTAHRGAKSASAILSSKKDRYMLSPCAARGQFVVVELCDDIRIDTVQLANHEFFSGVFRDFEVWVAKTYATDTDGWTFAGTYRAQNVRGVQSFHPPTTLTDFYRFIRIDFHSHYGNEYYCPVSLLRVYGLTHLEHWKWDLWEAESRAKRIVEDPGANSVGPAEVAEKPPQPVHVSAIIPVEVLPKTSLSDVPITSSDEQASQHPFTGDSTISESSSPSGAANDDVNAATPSPESTVLDTTTASSAGITSVHDAGEAARSKTSTPPPLIQPPALPRTKTENELPDVKPLATSTHHGHDAESQNPDTSHDSSRISITDSLYNNVSPLDSPTPASPSVSLSSSSQSASSSASPLSTVSTLQSAAPVSSASTALSISSLLSSLNLSAQASRLVSASASFSASLSTPGTAPANPSSQSLTIAPPPPPPPLPVAASANSGESIYRTIMNRLIALETNTTLYARFVEDHTANVRDMLRRLSEDIGRLEGIGRQQAQNYQRSVAEFQRKQRRLELEHKELMSKVVHLTDEVVLEKRLGIAQLCLLLTVLVFMALTRGSRSELMQGPVSGMRSRTTSLRGWGSRTLSLSGEWVDKVKGANRPPSIEGQDHEPIRSSEKATEDISSKANPPSQGVQTTTEVELRSRRSFGPTLVSPRRLVFPVRPHTPSSARIPRHHSPQHYSTTPTATTAGAGPSFPPGARPQVQRVQSGGSVTQSLSMGVLGPVPRSAKRWARTAHIHQVKNASSRRSVSGDFGERAKRDREGEGEDADVFGAPAMRSAPSVSDAERELLPVAFPSVATGSEASEGDGTQWEDTDAEGSDFDLSR